MRAGRLLAACLVTLSSVAAAAEGAGRDVYMRRCFFCHGAEGRGDGPAAIGMLPRPRDFVRADYKVRSTPHGQLPTDEDLFRVISRGLPGTPMPGWERILGEDERRRLVSYLKSLSPRFASEPLNPLPVPAGTGSAERGKEVYRRARCFLCHGERGRGDGPITTTLNFEWGLPHAARDLTRGWTFKGGHEPRDIYLRITGGLNGTPMGPYKDLLSDEERLDLAHYVASLDEEPAETSEDFVVAAAFLEGEIPSAPTTPEWARARTVRVPLAGQIVRDPPLRWWIPTAGSASLQALWNGREIGFLLEWNDPTESKAGLPDSAFLQLAAEADARPYFLLGDKDHAVKLWHWQAGGGAEEWTAKGPGEVSVAPAAFEVFPTFEDGRWRVIFRRALGGEPSFEQGRFLPILFSARDGQNGERGEVRALSTWLYATLEPPPSVRPWLSGLVYALGALIAIVWTVSRLRS